MALVSILNPVYNGERFLRPCIESVLKQTYQDWEYIFVDNCSEDATPEIIREYARQDRRIRVVTNESFVGIIENHNIAFSQMSPKADYCKVVQADDWIYPECLEKFVCSVRCESGGLPGDRLSLWTATGWGLKGLPETQSVFCGREIVRSFFFDEPPGHLRVPDILFSPGGARPGPPPSSIRRTSTRTLKRASRSSGKGTLDSSMRS